MGKSQAGGKVARSHLRIGRVTILLLEVNCLRAWFERRQWEEGFVGEGLRDGLLILKVEGMRYVSLLIYFGSELFYFEIEFEIPRSHPAA